jgi:NDP-hexose 4-ketoreductase
MNIVGNGLIARSLRPLRDMHPRAMVLAAGAPRHNLPETELEREMRLVSDSIVECRRKEQMLVFFSTTSMYGGPGSNGREDEPVTPSTAYGQHKLGLERLIADSGIEYLILRLTQVIGPGEPEFRLLASLISQMKAGRVRIQRDARRDLLYISGFVAVLDRLLGNEVRNEVVNVASGDCVPVTWIADHLDKRLGIAAEKEITPGGIAYCSSVEKLRALAPEVTGMGFGPGYFRHAIDSYLVDGGYCSLTIQISFPTHRWQFERREQARVLERCSGRCSLIVLLARCSAVDRGHAPAVSAPVSLAGTPTTSRKIRTARCLGGKYWIAAMNASSIVSLATTAASGCDSTGPAASSSRSGNACSHAMSVRGGRATSGPVGAAS